MESTSATTLIQPTRQEQFRLWIARSGLSFSELGEALGITGVSVARLVDGPVISTKRHAQLVGRGVPAALLPQAVDRKPGRKPCRASVHHEFEAAYKG